jgi:hypothetical protein
MAVDISVVGFVLGDGIRKLAAEILIAIEKRYDSATRILSRKMAIDDSCDIGMTNELINQTDTGVVDDDDSVRALTCNILDESIRVVVVCANAIESFSCIGIDEYKTGIRAIGHRRRLAQVV